MLVSLMLGVIFPRNKFQKEQPKPTVKYFISVLKYFKPLLIFASTSEERACKYWKGNSNKVKDNI